MLFTTALLKSKDIVSCQELLFLLPPANEVWDKVMFLHLSVSFRSPSSLAPPHPTRPRPLVFTKVKNFQPILHATTVIRWLLFNNKYPRKC